MFTLLLAACLPPHAPTTSETSDTAATPEPAPTGATGTTGATGDTGTALPPLGMAGDCDVSSSGQELAGVRQAVIPFAYGVPNGLHVQWFADAASLDAVWWNYYGVPMTDPLDVDFDTELAVVVTYAIDSSCSVDLDGVDVWAGDVPHVEVRIRDSSWGCDMACDMEWATAVVLAVPRTDALTVCGLVGDGCDAGLP